MIKFTCTSGPNVLVFSISCKIATIILKNLLEKAGWVVKTTQEDT